jgi:hypothetical protein
MCVFPISLVQPLRTVIDLDLFNGSLQLLYLRSVRYQDICEGGMLGDVKEVHSDVTRHREMFSHFTIVSRFFPVLGQNRSAILCRILS